jgi:hypothetical protein
MLQLSPQHSVKGSTVFWIGLGAIATLMGLGAVIFPKLFEKPSVSGTCPTDTKCCTSCGYSGKRLLIGGLCVTTAVGVVIGYFLHSTSKSNGGGGLSPALLQALASGNY